MMVSSTLLITCFEPFGGHETNASRDAVMALPGEIGPFALRRICLPVAFGRAAKIAIAAANELRPAAIICVGEAGGRAAITPERVARNLRNARIPDNDGARLHDEPVLAGGPEELLSPLPVDAMVAAIRAAGIPAETSTDAGAYVCNDLMYLMLRHCETSATPCGFIHVPAGQELDTATIARGLEAAIRALAKP